MGTAELKQVGTVPEQESPSILEQSNQNPNPDSTLVNESVTDSNPHDIKQATAEIESQGGLEAHKNRYGTDISKCPFIGSMGEAGIKLVEKMEASQNNEARGKTIAELMAAKEAQKEQSTAANKVKVLVKENAQVTSETPVPRSTIPDTELTIVSTHQTKTIELIKVPELEYRKVTDNLQETKEINTNLKVSQSSIKRKLESHVNDQLVSDFIPSEVIPGTAIRAIPEEPVATHINKSPYLVKGHTKTEPKNPEIAHAPTSSINIEATPVTVERRSNTAVITAKLDLPVSGELVDDEKEQDYEDVIEDTPVIQELELLNDLVVVLETLEPAKDYQLSLETEPLPFVNLLKPEKLLKTQTILEEVAQVMADFFENSSEDVDQNVVYIQLQAKCVELFEHLGMPAEEEFVKNFVYEFFSTNDEGTHEQKSRFMHDFYAHLSQTVHQYFLRFAILSRYILQLSKLRTAG